uniref:ANK_REP_REGION domain-containing protein n=1 Tax=Haemonchus contortus TaxID=6289 RepID=A0A7I4YY28_HAECO
MLPEPSKGKKKPDIEDKDNAKKTDKRRNSLTDSSTFSTSTSSNSSSVDSDEAVSWLGTLCDSKGTMTVPTENVTNAEEQVVKADLEKFRRPIRTDNSTAEEYRRIHGFRSLADDFNNVLSVENNKNCNNEITKPAVIQTKKRVEKLRKEREKKDRKDRERAAAAKKEVENREANRQSALFECEKERCVREMVRCNQRRGQHTLGPVHYGSASLVASMDSTNSTPTETIRIAKQEEKLRACVGFGIAATGVYDHLPKIACARITRPPYYSDLVGAHKENWRESYQDFYLQEHNHVGALFVERDALEDMAVKMETIASMNDSVYSNKWLRKLLMLVLKGKIRKVWRRMLIISELLRDYDSHNNRFRVLGLRQVVEHIMKSIVNLTRDPQNNTNVVMYLSSQYAGRKPCFLEKHCQCLMLDLILSSLSPSECGKVTMEKTSMCHRQAVHFAVISGQPCQLNVLMKHGTPCNEFDKSKQAPIHYLVERNNVLMVRQFMWYGSDMSIVEPSLPKVPSELFNVDNGEVCTFLQTRMKALERIMATWLKAICAGKLQLGNAASSLHSVRFLPPGGADGGIDQSSDPRRLLIGLRPDVIGEVTEGDSLVVFMLPVAFTPQDALMPAAYPHIVRMEMFEASYEPYKQALSLMKAPTLCVTADQLLSKVYSTVPVFREVHNGYLYAWRIPCKNSVLKGIEFASLHCTMDTSKMDPQVARQSMLFVQIFVVKSATPGRGKQKLE